MNTSPRLTKVLSHLADKSPEYTRWVKVHITVTNLHVMRMNKIMGNDMYIINIEDTVSILF